MHHYTLHPAVGVSFLVRGEFCTSIHWSLLPVMRISIKDVSITSDSIRLWKQENQNYERYSFNTRCLIVKEGIQIHTISCTAYNTAVFLSAYSYSPL
jgi:hypothetical protein